MVEQEVDDVAIGPLNRGPQFDSLRAPLLQFPAPLAQTLGGVWHRVPGHFRPALIHDPHRMRLFRPIHADVVTHSSSVFWRRLTAGAWERPGSPYTGPLRGHFLLNLWCRSFADRDTLLPSFRELCGERSSGQQASDRELERLCLVEPPIVFLPHTVADDVARAAS